MSLKLKNEEPAKPMKDIQIIQDIKDIQDIREEKLSQISGVNAMDKAMKEKTVRKVAMVILFVGVALLFGGLAAYLHNDYFLKNAETVTGVVTEKRMHRNYLTCSIYVNYEVDGKTYDELYVSDGHNMQIGQNVTVYYNPDKPTEITDGREITMLFICLIVMGGIVFLIGGYMVFWINQNPDKGIRIYERIFQKTGRNK